MHRGFLASRKRKSSEHQGLVSASTPSAPPAAHTPHSASGGPGRTGPFARAPSGADVNTSPPPSSSPFDKIPSPYFRGDGPFSGPSQRRWFTPSRDSIIRVTHVCGEVTTQSTHVEGKALVDALTHLHKELERIRPTLSRDMDSCTSYAALAMTDEEKMAPRLLDMVYQALSPVLANALPPPITNSKDTNHTKEKKNLALSDAGVERTFQCLTWLGGQWWPSFRPPVAAQGRKSAFELFFQMGIMFLERVVQRPDPSPPAVAAVCSFLFALLRPRACAIRQETVPTLDALEPLGCDLGLPEQVYPPPELSVRASDPSTEMYLPLRRVISVCCLLLVPRKDADPSVQLAALRLLRACACTWIVPDTLQVGEDVLLRSLLGPHRAVPGSGSALKLHAPIYGRVVPAAIAKQWRINIEGYLVGDTKQGGILPQTVSRLTQLLVANQGGALALDLLRCLLVYALNDASAPEPDDETLTSVRHVVNILSNRAWPSSGPQLAMVRLSFALLTECAGVLGTCTLESTQEDADGTTDGLKSVRTLTRVLVDLASPQGAKVVAETAQRALGRALPLTPLIGKSLADELGDALRALPAQVRSKYDLSHSTRRVDSLLRLCELSESLPVEVGDALVDLAKGEWLPPLLGALVQVEAQVQKSQTPELVLDTPSSLGSMFYTIGRTLAVLALTPLRKRGATPRKLVVGLLRAVEFQNEGRSISLFVVERALGGAGDLFSSPHCQRKPKLARKVARELAGETTILAAALFDPFAGAEQIQNEALDFPDHAEANTALIPRLPSVGRVEYTRGAPLRASASGVEALEANTVLDVGNVRPALLSDQTLSTLRAKQSQDRGEMLLPLLFAHASRLAGEEYAGTFVDVAYNAVRGLASADACTRDAALEALQTIAYHTGYPSLRMLVLDNVDYIISHAVSAVRRGVAPNQLSATAAEAGPLVLVELVRLLGSEVVVHIHDAVDDLLDALDNFQGHPEYVEGIASVLTGVIDVLAAQPINGPHPVEPGQRQLRPIKSRTEHIRSLSRLLKAHTCVADFEEEAASPSDALERGDQEKSKDPGQERMKEIIESIMERAIGLLGHPTPQLRGQALHLLLGGGKSLSRMGRWDSALPLMARAWPYLLLRFKEEGEVLVHALQTLGAWAEIAPDFLAARFAKEAWPRLRSVLAKLVAAPSTNMEADVGPFNPHEKGRRRALLLALMESLTRVCQAVGPRLDGDVTWALCVHPTFLHALAAKDPRIQRAARALFTALSGVNAGAVWASLETCRSPTLSVWGRNDCVPHSVRICIPEMPMA